MDLRKRTQRVSYHTMGVKGLLDSVEEQQPTCKQTKEKENRCQKKSWVQRENPLVESDTKETEEKGRDELLGVEKKGEDKESPMEDELEEGLGKLSLNPSSMTVADLRQHLKARGLDSKGTKAVLIGRLIATLARDEGKEPAMEEDEEDNEKGGEKENRVEKVKGNINISPDLNLLGPTSVFEGTCALLFLISDSE